MAAGCSSDSGDVAVESADPSSVAASPTAEPADGAEVIEESSANTSYSEGMEIGAEITINCGGLVVYALSPSGSSIPEDENTLISPTEFSSCQFDLDTNGDGYSNASDELGDIVSVRGGLVETIAGGTADVSVLDDPANTCSGTRQEIAAPGDWTRATSCVVDGSIHSIYYLIIGHTPDNLPATVSCGVDASGIPLDGREDAVETTCFSVLASMFGGD